jgi:hypothetical protein
LPRGTRKDRQTDKNSLPQPFQEEEEEEEEEDGKNEKQAENAAQQKQVRGLETFVYMAGI